MNELGARAAPTYGGFYGEFRRVHRSQWERVCVNGVAQIYDTADRAEVMAWRALKAHLFGLVRRDGERMGAARSEAEKAFGQVFVKHKPVKVERK